MRVQVIPNFATAAEIVELNAWTVLGVKKGWLDAGITTNGNFTSKRLTSRLYGHRYKYPKVAIDLSNRIRDFVGLKEYPFILGHGRDGIVVSFTPPGGDVYRHKDPKGSESTATLRCNILTQNADSGGALYVDGQKINVGVGDLHCYLVSEHEHWVTEVEGSTPRIMWMFGAHVPAEDWNSEKIGANCGVS